MIIFYSLWKSWKLGRLLRKYRNRLINGYVQSSEIAEDIYTFCLSDTNLKTIVFKHNATKDDFIEIYMLIMASGAGMWSKDGHFVPISAFAFESTLDYLLSNKNLLHTPEAALKLVDYFEAW